MVPCKDTKIPPSHAHKFYEHFVIVFIANGALSDEKRAIVQMSDGVQMRDI